MRRSVGDSQHGVDQQVDVRGAAVHLFALVAGAQTVSFDPVSVSRTGRKQPQVAQSTFPLFEYLPFHILSPAISMSAAWAWKTEKMWPRTEHRSSNLHGQSDVGSGTKIRLKGPPPMEDSKTNSAWGLAKS